MANEVRLIDASILRSHFLGYVRTPPHFHYGDWQNMCINGREIDEVIETAPTVDAEPVVHGRWQLVEYQSSPFGVDQEYQCSICGTPVDDENYRTRYCPNCGAKMDGGNEDVV